MVDACFMFARRRGWTIGEGEVSFWFDNWDMDFNHEALAMEGFSSNKLCDFWMGEESNFDDLIPTLGNELVHYAIDCAPTISEEKDVLFWNLTASGVFSVKSARDSIRRRGPMDQTSCLVWVSPLLTQLNFLFGICLRLSYRRTW